MRTRASCINVSHSSIRPVSLNDRASSLFVKAVALSSSLAEVMPIRRSYSLISSTHLPSSARTAFIWVSEPLEKSISTAHIGEQNKRNITFVALEEVTDPRNIGSIIRSAASFNIDGLIIKERSFPSESKLLYKSASGCVEHINIFEVSNINTTLKYLKKKSFWICGFSKNADKNFTEHDWSGNNVLLFGSEGYGLKYQTIKNSDFLLKININKKIESLNISNSAAIIFHHINNLIKKN